MLAIFFGTFCISYNRGYKAICFLSDFFHHHEKKKCERVKEEKMLQFLPQLQRKWKMKSDPQDEQRMQNTEFKG